MTRRLADRVSGALFFAPRFTMLIWPAGSNAWDVIEPKLNPVPEGTVLRFLVRDPLPQEYTEELHPSILHFCNQNPEQHDEAMAKIKARPIQTGEAAINVIFRDLFSVEYARLATHPYSSDGAKNDTFFLCFLPVNQELWEADPEKRRRTRERTSNEHDLFVEFLQANGAKEIYSMQDIGSTEMANNGAWECFRKNDQAGCIVVSLNLAEGAHLLIVS